VSSINRETLKAKEIVYILVQLIPPGKVTTYSSLAKIFGKDPRVIARILKENKNPIVIPCHRVIYKDGRLGGYSFGGPKIKKKLLELEGVKIINNRVNKDHIIDIEKAMEKGEKIEVDLECI